MKGKEDEQVNGNNAISGNSNIVTLLNRTRGNNNEWVLDTKKVNNGYPLLKKTVTIQPTANTSNPTDVTVHAGEGATFTVTATGDDLSYQWYKGDVAISGATSSDYSISSTNLDDEGSYSCKVSGEGG